MSRIIKKKNKDNRQISVKKLICVCGLCDCGDSNNTSVLACANSGLMFSYSKDNQSDVDIPPYEN